KDQAFRNKPRTGRLQKGIMRYVLTALTLLAALCHAQTAVTPSPNTQSKPTAPVPGEQTSTMPLDKGGTGIEGIVTDQSGAVVKGAIVTVRSASGATQTAVTDDAGAYRITGLSPEKYDVSVTAPGFSEFKTESYSVASGSVGMLDAQLTPAGVATNVKVE